MDSSLYIKGATVVLPTGSTRCDVVVENGRITGLPRSYANLRELPELDAEGMTVLPGFIDIHTHGAANVDVNAADEEGLRTIGRFFASQGVTGWLCSVLTDTPEQTLWCMEQAKRVIEGGPYDGAAIWGVAIESDLYVEAICDGRHLHPGSVRLYLKSKGWDRVVAITDSIMAAGLPDGNYKLGVNDVVVEDGDAKLASTGVRAGSTLTLATIGLE